MKKALLIVLPILAALAILAFVLFPGSFRSKERKRIEALWAESKAVVLAEITAAEKTPRFRKSRRLGVDYKVDSVYMGMKTETFHVGYEIPGEGPVELPPDFSVGTRQLLFLRVATWGPMGGDGYDTPDRALPPTPERIKILEKLSSDQVPR